VGRTNPNNQFVSYHLNTSVHWFRISTF